MIRNMPSEINALKIREFNFGSIEGADDELLDDCFCHTESVREFQTNRYNILLGAKGAGKSAVFSQLRKQQLLFDGVSRDKCLILPLDEELQYESLRLLIDSGLQTITTQPEVRALFIWETYILFRLAVVFSQRRDTPGNLKKLLSEFTDALIGNPEKPSLYSIVSSFLPTFTFKIDASDPSMLAPSFSVSPSNSPTPPKQQRPEVNTIDLQKVKRAINTLAKGNGIHIFVLIDHLDDFVAREDYKTQKILLEGLIRCCRNYDGHDHIHLRMFLRTDLYEKLDFSQLGGRTKTDQRCVELKWSGENMRQFIAERLLFNLMKTYDMSRLAVSIDRQALYFRNQSAAPRHRRSRLWRWLFEPGNPGDMYDERHVHLRDQAYRELISAFLPDSIPHFDHDGVVDDTGIFDYFQTHFQLANGECTPRHVLLFLQNLRRMAAQYYDSNPDQELIENTNGQFKLFHPAHVLQAYHELQSKMCDIFKGCITYLPWQKKLETFFEKKKRSTAFSAARLKSILKPETESDFREFMACMENLRIVSRRDKTQPLEERMYELPILLQFIFDPSKYATRSQAAAE